MKKAEIQVVIDEENAPSEDQLKIIEKELQEIFDYKFEKNEFKSCNLSIGSGKMSVQASIVSEREVPVVAVVETFMQLLGNVRVYRKILNYKNE